MRIFKVLPLCLALVGISACTSDDSKKPKTVGHELVRKLQPEVSSQNYLSGRAFCDYYKEQLKGENGKFVRVPKDYNNPSAGTTEVYTWTDRPFDPSLPTFVKVDGGPGQNTHTFPNYFASGWNEIHFDQRGLGCSAPGTFEEYQDPNLYSTENTVKDMEAIRKAWQVEKWTIFGISYGTVPATQYGSLYPSHTVAVVIEGVFHGIEDMHGAEWKVSKLNAALDQLSYSKRRGFNQLLQSDHVYTVAGLIQTIFFMENGFALFAAYLDKVIINENQFNEKTLAVLKKALDSQDFQSQYPQVPTGVDSRVYSVIYCRELGGFRASKDFNWDTNSMKFIVTYDGATQRSKNCEKYGVLRSSEKLYVPSRFPVRVPIFYLQGSHDSATLASGALKHWREVPKGLSRFLLKTKGGHNPMGNALRSENSEVKQAHQNLFSMILKGTAISESNVADTNQTLEKAKGKPWILYTSPARQNPSNHFEGIIEKTANF